MKNISKIDPAELWEEIESNASNKSRDAEEKVISLPQAGPSGPKPTVGGKHQLETPNTMPIEVLGAENPEFTTELIVPNSGSTTKTSSTTTPHNTPEINQERFPFNLPREFQ